ncbi:MAG: ComF family protein [Candidatus Pacebacteria bacterium]|nr:ComF family protein [Candidatus Paceibacterota bacterium]
MMIINTILDFLFPIRCVSCRESGSYLCDKCALQIRKAERENLEWVYSLYDYRDPVIKKALWLLKYKNKKPVAETFARLVYGIMLEEISELVMMKNWRDPVLVPIPLSKARLRERGYNQTELVAKAIVKLDQNQNFKLKTMWLKKIKETPRQAHIKNRNERLLNLKDSFEVSADTEVKGKNIILLDDVTTTGATLSEARKALKNAGARDVVAFTLAH